MATSTASNLRITRSNSQLKNPTLNFNSSNTTSLNPHPNTYGSPSRQPGTSCDARLTNDHPSRSMSYAKSVGAIASPLVSANRTSPSVDSLQQSPSPTERNFSPPVNDPFPPLVGASTPPPSGATLV